jgi:pyrimidine deaminase RibD-like protein
VHLNFLRLALHEARKCSPTPTAFCVGCVVTAPWPLDGPISTSRVFSTGFSRELEGNTHAEANALAKMKAMDRSQIAQLLPDGAILNDGFTVDVVLRHASVYTTLEPCSVRTSGLPPCADALISAQIKRCFIGVREPDDFVICEGTKKLRDAGIEVIYIDDLESECLQVARRGHTANE